VLLLLLLLLLQELEEEWEKARPLLKEAMCAAGWTATAESSYEEYLEALAGQQQQQEDGECSCAGCRLWVRAHGLMISLCPVMA
jgi:hypothetical protein